MSVASEARDEAEQQYPLTYRYDGEEIPDRVAPVCRDAFVVGAEWQASRSVTDEDIQRGVEIALKEGLSGRTWPEYIRAVYDAVVGAAND